MASVGTCGATRGQVVGVAMLLAGAARSLERGEDWGPEWGGQLLRVPSLTPGFPLCVPERQGHRSFFTVPAYPHAVPHDLCERVKDEASRGLTWRYRNTLLSWWQPSG